ncbi:hypothetical protein G7Y89_g12976 [Cudoniella acicularis]|uniref:Initiation-specific alpha-1,6-mannosyltransferase n=1 Tax=Cudoniella acicularis TaxID=354080 RepID=A0A8H4VWI0_9HELO|nr:hypothetical protein G7Y89_g12976 [Cudoniella acicularis]
MHLPTKLLKILTILIPATLFTLTLIYLYNYHDICLPHTIICSYRHIKLHPFTSTPLPPIEDATSLIPKKIWYKLTAAGLSDKSQVFDATCLNQNPHYRHEFLTELQAETYVREHYSEERRDIVEVFMLLRIPIVRADLLRYLILYKEGGVWSDLDVSCGEQYGNMNKWVPNRYKNVTGLVLGLEFDCAIVCPASRVPVSEQGRIRTQFASWMIMAAPKSPHMKVVIEDILTEVNYTASWNGVEVDELTLEMIGDVVDFSGPKRLTTSVVKSMGREMGEAINDSHFTGLKEPKLLGDVLLLPGNAFAASQNGFPKDQGPALVTHHYAGTWKNEFGGELPDP